MADIAEESLLDIEDTAEMVKLNGVVHDKEEGEVFKNTMLHCLTFLLTYLLTTSTYYLLPTTYYYQLLHIITYYYLLLPITTHYYILLPSTIYY